MMMMMSLTERTAQACRRSLLLVIALTPACTIGSDLRDSDEQPAAAVEEELNWAEIVTPLYTRASGEAPPESIGQRSGQVVAHARSVSEGTRASEAWVEQQFFVPSFVTSATARARFSLAEARASVGTSGFLGYGNAGAKVRLSVLVAGTEVCSDEDTILNLSVAFRHVYDETLHLTCRPALPAAFSGPLHVRVTLRAWADAFLVHASSTTRGTLASVELIKDSGAESAGDVLSTDLATGLNSKLDGWFCLGSERCEVGYGMAGGKVLDSRRPASLVAFAAGEAYVGPLVRTPAVIDVPVGERLWGEDVCRMSEICRLGDVNGDNRDDVVAFDRAGSRARISVNTGDRAFASPITHAMPACVGSDHCFVADANGDGFADVVVFKTPRITWRGAAPSTVEAALNDGTGAFLAPAVWHPTFRGWGQKHAVADIDGGGHADLLRVEPSTGDVFVALSTGTSFGESTRVRANVLTDGAEDWNDVQIADFDQDGRADLVNFTHNPRGDVLIVTSSIGGLLDRETETITGTVCTSIEQTCRVAGQERIVAFLH